MTRVAPSIFPSSMRKKEKKEKEARKGEEKRRDRTGPTVASSFPAATTNLFREKGKIRQGKKKGKGKGQPHRQTPRPVQPCPEEGGKKEGEKKETRRRTTASRDLKPIGRRKECKGEGKGKRGSLLSAYDSSSVNPRITEEKGRKRKKNTLKGKRKKGKTDARFHCSYLRPVGGRNPKGKERLRAVR